MIIGTAACCGQIPNAEPDDYDILSLAPTSTTLTSKFRSQYVFSNGFVVHDEPVIQTDLFVTFEHGVFADLWTSVPTNLSEIGDNFGTEAMLTLGWKGRVGDYNLSFAVEYEDLHNTLSFEGTDFQIFVGDVSRDFKATDDFTITPFLHLETNFTFDGVVQGDTLPRLGTRLSWHINDIVSVSSQIMAVYDPGILGGDAGWIGNAEAAFNWKIKDNLFLEAPYTRLIQPITAFSDADGRNTEIVFGFGLSYTF